MGDVHALTGSDFGDVRPKSASEIEPQVAKQLIPLRVEEDGPSGSLRFVSPLMQQLARKTTVRQARRHGPVEPTAEMMSIMTNREKHELSLAKTEKKQESTPESTGLSRSLPAPLPAALDNTKLAAVTFLAADSNPQALPRRSLASQSANTAEELWGQHFRFPKEEVYFRYSYRFREELSLTMWENEVSPDMTQYLAALYPGCKGLELNGLPRVDYQQVRSIAVHFGHLLLSLDISDCVLVDDHVTKLISTRFTALETLKIARNCACTDDTLEALGQNAKQLSDLDISGLPLITNQGILSLIGVVQTAAGIKHTRSQILVKDRGCGARLKGLAMVNCQQLDDVTMHALSKCVLLEKVDISDCHRFTDEGLQALLSVCNKLSTLKANRVQNLSDSAVHALLEAKVAYGFKRTGGFEYLRNLELQDLPVLSDVSLSWVAAACANLNTLRLDNCTQLVGAKGMAAIGTMKQLEHLHLINCASVSDDGMSILFQGDPHNASNPHGNKNLVEVDLTGCTSVSDVGVRALGGSAARMVKIVLNGMGLLTENAIHFLVKKCQATLRHLFLADCHRLDDQSARHIGKHMRRLRSLDVSGWGLSDQGAKNLSGLRKLEVLHMNRCTQLTEAGIAQAPCWALQELHCKGLAQMHSDKGLRDLLRSQRQFSKPVTMAPLRRFDLSYCPAVTNETVIWLVANAGKHFVSLNVAGCQNVSREQLHETSTSRPYLEAITMPGEANGFRGVRLSREGRMMKYQDDAIEFIADSWGAAIKCQCIYRQCKAKLTMNVKRFEQENIKEWAAVKMQCWFRGRLGRQLVRIHREQMTNAAIYVQYAYRKHMVTRRERRAAMHLFRHLGHKVLINWLKATNDGREARLERKSRAQYERALHFFKNRVLLKAWPAWIHWMAHHKARKLLLEKAQMFWGGGMIGPLFETWVANAKESKRRRQRLTAVFWNVCGVHTYNSEGSYLRAQNAIQFSLGRAKRRVWKMWIGLYREREELWMKACKADAQNFLHKFGLDVWRSWVQYAAWRRIKREWIVTAEECCLKLRQKKGVRYLHLYAEERIYKREAFERAAKMWKQQNSHVMFQHWQTYYQQRKQHKALLLKAYKAWMYQKQKKAINSWLEWAIERVRYKDMVEKALKLFMGNTKKETVTAWRLVVADMSDSKAALLSRQLLRTQGTAFKGLKSMWRLAQQKRVNQRSEWQVATRAAVHLQARWRGRAGREKAEEWKFFQEWATTQLQALARRWKAKKELARRRRHANVLELVDMEAEQEFMWEENVEAAAMRMEWDAAVQLQRAFLGHKGRCVAYLTKQLRVKEKGLLFKLQQQDARDEAMRREQERERRMKLEWKTANFIQRVYRGYRGRVRFHGVKEAKLEYNAGMLLQAHYRGRRGRRAAWAKRRVDATKARVLARRQALGKFMRVLGLKHRSLQRPFLLRLFELGLDPDSFNFNPKSILSEMKGDLLEFLRDAKIEVEAWSDKKTVVQTDAFERERVRIAYQRLYEKKNLPSRGDIVRVRARNHDAQGWTGCVLKVDNTDPNNIQAEIRMDHNDTVEYIRVWQEETDTEARALALHPADKLDGGVMLPKAIIENRANLLIAADHWRMKRHEDLCAQAIQRRWLCYIAKTRMLTIRTMYRQLVSSRREKLFYQLQSMGLASARVGRFLKMAGMVKKDFIPEMEEKPLMPPGVLESVQEFQLYWVRRQETSIRMSKRKLWLQNERNIKKKRVMRWRRMFVPRKIGAYIAARLMASTTGRVADMLHGNAMKFEEGTLCRDLNEAMANLVGGLEWRRTYEDRNAWAAMTQLLHLEGSPHITLAGWCMYHGVWGPPGIGRRIGGDHPDAYKPHGEGVAELLKGNLMVLEHPSSCVVTEGATARLRVRADGGIDPYVYRWFRKMKGMSQFQEIGQDNNPTSNLPDLAFAGITQMDAGLYKCEVKEDIEEIRAHNGFRTARVVWSNECTIAVKDRLLMVSEPMDHELSHSSKFSVACKVVGGYPPYKYQWRLDQGKGPKDLITNGQNRKYDLNPATQFDSGEYSCEIHDAGGGVIESDYCTVVINKPIEVVEEPECGAITAGDELLLRVEAGGGTPPYFYTWVHDGVDQPTNERCIGEEFQYYIPEVSIQNAGRWWVRVHDSGGATTQSDPVFVNIFGPVHVTVVRATEVVAIEWMQSNAFVTLTVNKEEHKTRVREHTLNPVWTEWAITGEMIRSEHYTFNVNDIKNTLVMVVEHKRDDAGASAGSEFMGKVEVPLVDLKHGQEVRQFFPLMNRKGKLEKKSRGDMEVILRWEQPPALHSSELTAVEQTIDSMITHIETFYTVNILMNEMLDQVCEEGGEAPPVDETHSMNEALAKWDATASPLRKFMPRYLNVSGSFEEGRICGMVLINYNNGDKYKGPYVDEAYLDENGRTRWVVECWIHVLDLI
jgi:hypothetical protein